MKNCTRKDHLPWIIGLAFAARSSWPLFRNLKLFLDEMFQGNALKAIFLECRNFVAFFMVLSLKYLAKFWSISFTKHKPIYFWRVWPSISCSLFNIKHPTQTFSYFIYFHIFQTSRNFQLATFGWWSWLWYVGSTSNQLAYKVSTTRKNSWKWPGIVKYSWKWQFKKNCENTMVY